MAALQHQAGTFTKGQARIHLSPILADPQVLYTNRVGLDLRVERDSIRE